MMDWLWSPQGRLAWPLFSALVYTAVLVLAADYVWRLITRPASQIAAGVAVLWLFGMVVIYVISA